MGKKKVALLSNITVDLVAAKLRKKYDFYIPEGFDTWVQETINPESGLYRESPDSIIVLLDGTEARSWKNEEEGFERISLWQQALTTLIDNISDIPVFVTIVDFRENRIKAISERKHSPEYAYVWYKFIQDKVEKGTNLYVLDIADAIADAGRKTCYSNKMWYISSMPYSREGIAIVADEIDKALQAAFSPRKKIAVLDLDNTLWGGVIGEDGLEGIELSEHKEGQRYYDFQRQLYEMKMRGVVLAIDSKNNEDDAEEAISNHPAMLLRDADFVSKKINWNDKASNIRELERELNITEGGFVFIDDNPVEREIVKGECTDVTVPVFPEDTSELISFGEELWKEYFRPLRVLAEDVKKTQMYQSEIKRKHELTESLNLNDYISRLEVSIDIHRMTPGEMDRVVQLCNKTNQFNLTTKRYTKADIQNIIDNQNNSIYTVHSKDKYGDNGLVSVIILIDDNENIRIDTFLMSCRVMGRKIEEAIINELALANSSKQYLTGEYIPTAKNKPVQTLYERLGFTLVSENEGHKRYKLDLNNYTGTTMDMFKNIAFEQ